MLTDIFQLIFKLMNAYEHWEVYKIQGVLETLPETKRIGKKKTYRQQFVNRFLYSQIAAPQVPIVRKI